MHHAISMQRRKSHKVKIGNVTIGGDSPVAIQSMTNTDTADVNATVTQIIELADAGSELVRIAVNNERAAQAVPEIRKKLHARKYSVPLIGDFHFSGHALLEKFPECAQALDKYRINPGNVETSADRGRNFETMVRLAIKYGKPIRIGANWGSIDDRDLVKSVIGLARKAEKLGLPANKIVLSAKTSDFQSTIRAYEMLAKRTKYALHLGLTEAGSGIKGLVASSAALAVLLQKGIGDTIRISLMPGIGQPRKAEVEACRFLLQSMGLRNFYPFVTSCPGCGRTDNILFQRLAGEVNEYVEKYLFARQRTRGQFKNSKIQKLKIAVMGCSVNGPGEARHADIALVLPGRSEKPIAMVFVRGRLFKTLTGRSIGQNFLEILEQFIKKDCQ